MLVNPLEYLQAGRANGWAVGGFNVYNLESARAVIAAATNLSSPVMVQTSEGAADVHDLEANHLVLRIQPEEGIDFSFVAKQPGPEVSVQQVGMDFSYRDSFMTGPPEAYERLLHDAMAGDHTLFARADSVERGWALVEPALDPPAPLRVYPAGGWGPPEADELIAPRRWHLR